MRIDRIDIIKMFSDVAKRYPNSAIKTYAHLKYSDEFGDTSLNKTKNYSETVNEGIFYSKEWNDISKSANKIPFSFPSLVSFSNDFNNSNKQIMYSFEIYVCELLEVTDTEVWETKTKRIEKLLRSALKELIDNYVFATTNLDAAGSWYSKKVLDAALLNNDITTFEIDGDMKERIKNWNSFVFKIGYAETPKNLITVGTTLNILGCYTLDTDFNTAFTI